MIQSRLAFIQRGALGLGRTLATEPKRLRLRDVVPHVVRLKFCNDMEQDVASDNEWDYANYKVELDPDLPPLYTREDRVDPDWDVTEDEIDAFTQADFDEYWEEYIHKKRSRSDPSVKRAHHAWWHRMRKEQVAAANTPGRSYTIEGDRLHHSPKVPDFLDEYTSDDGTGIDFYTTESDFSIAAFRKAAIRNYKLPADQELPQSLIPQHEIVTKTYLLFRLEYYDALSTKQWHTLTDLHSVLYYVQAERAIPLFVPLEFRSIVPNELDMYFEPVSPKLKFDSQMHLFDDLVPPNTIVPKDPKGK